MAEGYKTGIRGPIKWKPIRRRLIKHHLPLLLLSAIGMTLTFLAVDSEYLLYRLSMATAYPGLFLLAATLLTGPLKVIRQRPNPVSDDLTRDIGIWAALVNLAHVVIGLQVHFGGRMWPYFLYQNLEFPYIRVGSFGIANHTGLIGTFILMMLLAISNNRALRRLGPGKWKRYQRWNYGLFGLVIVHGAIYQFNGGRSLPWVLIFGATGVLVAVMQWVGYLYNKNKQR